MDWCLTARSRVGQIGFLIFTTFLLSFSYAYAESKNTHNLFIGDFTGNRVPDLYFQGKTNSDAHTTYRVDEQLYTEVLDTWPNNLLGLNWDESQYKIQVGDFTAYAYYGGTCVQNDLFLQSKSEGSSYIVYPKDNQLFYTCDDDSNSPDVGKFIRTFEIPANILGISWDVNSSNIVLGKYRGGGFSTAFFIQGKDVDTSHHVVHFTPVSIFDPVQDNFDLKQTIDDGHLGLYWDAENIVPHSSDFNGDGYDDLFLQIKKNIMILPMDDLLVPIVMNPDNTTLAIVAAETVWDTQPAGTFHSIWDSWENGHLGIDWSANNYEVVIADFNGDNRDDILLQSKSGGTNHLIHSDVNGKFSTITPSSSNIQSFPSDHLGYNWSSSASEISTADFNRDGKADIVLFDSNGPHTITADQNGTFTDNSYILDETIFNTQPYEHRPGTIVVGDSGGSFSVGASGTASYAMDIVIPPALAGMKPALSMSYNSSGGNGIMGMGWNVGGLSSVMRCPQTFAEDGQIMDINFDLNDRLCLDGQRLVVVSGIYGQAGAEYRTEIDSFSRVTQMGGNIDSANAWFKVETKSGQTYEYGKTTDSELNLKDTVPAYMWTVNKITDISNNEVNVEYFEDIERGTYRVERINYTSINGGPASVRFFYESRIDVITGYVKGSPLATDKRLAAIETYVGENFVRSYEIYYDNSPATDRSRVSQIQQCSYDETCLPPVTFASTQTDNPWPTTYVDTELCANNDFLGKKTLCWEFERASIKYPDINGDGRSDMCYRTYTGIHCYLSTGSDFDYANPINSSICSDSDAGCRFVCSVGEEGVDPTCIDFDGHKTINYLDLNNDNLADLVYQTTTGYKVHFSTGTGFGPAVLTGLPAGYSNCNQTTGEGCIQQYPQFVELDGDGRIDMCYRNQVYGIVCYLGNGQGGFTKLVESQICRTGDPACNDDNNFGSIRMMDMDGDGRADIVYRGDSAGMSIHYFNGTGFDSPVTSGICKDGQDCIHNEIFYGDVNGDGLTDMCPRRSTGLQCYFNLGGFFDETKSVKTGLCTNADNGSGACDKYTIQMVDMNQDGRTDLTFRSTNNGIELHLSKAGSTLFNKVANPEAGKRCSSANTYNCNNSDNLYYTQYPDINGDGMLDQAIRSDDGVRVFLSTEFRQDMITTITDGFDNQTQINYDTLTNPAVYSQGNCASAYPLQCVIGPMRVVKDYQASNGIGGFNQYQYNYQDLRTHLRGRGIMGFGLMNKYDLVNDTRDEIYDEDYTTTLTPVNDTYPDTYLYKGLGSRKLSYGPGNVLLSQTVNNFDYKPTTGQAYFPYYLNSSEESWTPEGIKVSTVFIENDYSVTDAQHGNITSITTTTTDHINNVSFSNTTTNTYADVVDANNWQLARVSNTQVTHSTTLLDGDGLPVPSITKESSFSYLANGQLASTTIEPNNTELSMTTVYGYDQYGNRNSVTVSGGDIAGTISHVPARTTNTNVITNNGTSLNVSTAITNAVGHSQTSTADALTGVTLDSTGPNGITTYWTYDGFGRKLTETRADGTSSTISRNRCDDPANTLGCPALAKAYMITQGTIGPESRVYTDSMSRTILSLTTNLDNEYVFTINEYNAKGQVETGYDVGKKAISAFSFANVATTDKPGPIATTNYDQFNRVQSSKDLRLDVTSTNIYEGAKIKTEITGPNVPTNLDGTPRSTTKITYANGNLKSSTDADGNAVLNFYDVQGNLIETHSPGKTAGTLHKVKMTYDHKGRKISMDDPDMGIWNYEYDAAGKLIKQTDAVGNTLRNVYDLLDRQVLRIQPEGVSEWSYDNGYNAIGKLVHEAGPIPMSVAVINGYLTTPPTVDVIDETSAVFQRAYTYDELGRGGTVTTTIEGIAFEMQTSYDQYSRVVETIYPTSTNNQRLVVSNLYDPTNRGYLVQVDRHLQITDAQGVTVVPGSEQYVWKLGDNTDYNGAIDKYGNIIKETVGNNITTNHGYDSSGRLTNRIASGLGTVQSVSYVYDSLNNLTQRTDHAPDAQVGLRADLVENFFYDSLNRLERVALSGLPSQTVDIETMFTYEANGNIQSKTHAGNATYYWYESTRSHALTRTSSDALGNTDIANYLYNNNGSMLSGDGRTLEYTSFNKPDFIDKNGHTIRFNYDANHNRYKQTNPHGTTYYLSARYDAGTHFEREIETNGDVKDVHYLYGGTGLIGTFTLDNADVSETRYYHKDHLGSIEVITDENQQVRAKVGYSPFGERRDSLTNLLEISGVIDPVTSNKSDNHHWYTGHEHLDETGIIHMNGRVYDPALGRFLSADPNIQAPGYTQSYNRYSYIMNNPMNATDPSGYFLRGLRSVVEAIGPIAGKIALHDVTTREIYETDIRFRKQSNTYRQAATIAAAFFAPVTGGGSLVANAALNTWAVGGDIHDIAKAAIIAYATYQAYAAIGEGMNSYDVWGDQVISNTQGVFLHGAVGGFASAMQGGSFSSGFISGAVGKATTLGIADNIDDVIGKGIVVSISGGIAAELGGGKFSNGAMTAAMGYLLNSLTSYLANKKLQYNRAKQALNKLRGYKEFQDLEKNSSTGRFNLKIDYNEDSSAYDHESNTIIINPLNLRFAYATTVPDVEYDWGDSEWNAYPDYAPFSLERIIYHEALHSNGPAYTKAQYLLMKDTIEAPVITTTNRFMFRYFDQPYRKNHYEQRLISGL